MKTLAKILYTAAVLTTVGLAIPLAIPYIERNSEIINSNSEVNVNTRLLKDAIGMSYHHGLVLAQTTMDRNYDGLVDRVIVFSGNSGYEDSAHVFLGVALNNEGMTFSVGKYGVSANPSPFDISGLTYIVTIAPEPFLIQSMFSEGDKYCTNDILWPKVCYNPSSGKIIKK